jgi:hypothetical protein
MRVFSITTNGRKFIHHFLFIEIDGKEKEWWTIESYVILSHEIMVDWLEKGIHPNYKYT